MSPRRAPLSASILSTQMDATQRANQAEELALAPGTSDEIASLYVRAEDRLRDAAELLGRAYAIAFDAEETARHEATR